MNITDYNEADCISIWAHYKRLLELCTADAADMEKFLANPEKIINEAGLSLDGAAAKEAIEVHLRGIKTKNPNFYIELIDRLSKGQSCRKELLTERICPDNFSNQDLKAWFLRERNWNLYGSALVRKYTKEMRTYTAPISFELTKGCSGRCPFCCLAPQALEECFYYNDENADLWNSILVRTKEIIGDISGTGVCYFATDPFDNPDYEKFIEDFHRVFGYYPITTTVKALDDINRTKNFMQMLGEEQLKQSIVRFSIISKRQLERVYQAFTPEELVNIDLTLNNPESILGYSLAGRAINLKEKLPDEKFIPNYSPVCTTGFVVNMPQRSIRLLAPRNSDTGMRLYETMTFTDESSYESAIYELIAKWMKSEIPADKKICNNNITYERNGNYLKITGDKIHRTISLSEAAYQSLIRMLEGYTLKELFEELSMTEYERLSTTRFVQFLYDNGYIDIA